MSDFDDCRLLLIFGTSLQVRLNVSDCV